ncbi:protein O-linked-mannose beta-1,4-N-acetylglucosaminyltransferase 2-like isoform X3 [Carex littledalei]|uniref:Protein O-linked-mannose beta-1,4-N-acetylglucosaminyltransferase 2-like isoform X3 n=1 Tax=Carex littledalei TaxID=544730 RepID=A0A833RKZ0_9POAL|nr:protein O-linked-mannose beta-1,4-N-acetylglucosaminyltransferase 2-like isoform X3 [Carex littledalei]
MKQNFRYALLWACVVIVMLCLISLTSPRRTTDFVQCIGKEAEKSSSTTSSYKPFCDYSSDRSDVCDMKGDVRIYGASSSVFFIRYHQNGDQVGDDEIVRIRPYPRKFDPNLLERIGEVKITSTGNTARAYTCAENQSIPAIVFANGGFLGNFYHDFNDALIPLFITSRQFNGEVQFLITNMKAWWVRKYKPILSKLSNYELIDLKNEDRVRCYPRVIVNLHSHKKISIDPSRTPGNYSMVDFARILRTGYSLDREFVDISQRKPKLLIITRSRTRKFTNTEAIIYGRAAGL